MSGGLDTPDMSRSLLGNALFCGWYPPSASLPSGYILIDFDDCQALFFVAYKALVGDIVARSAFEWVLRLTSKVTFGCGIG
jgi:hypothetical protein